MLEPCSPPAPTEVDHQRRCYIGAVALAAVASPLALVADATAQEPPSARPRSGSPGFNGGASLGPLQHVEAGVLTIGYAELGPAGGTPVLLLHGWPYDIDSYADVAPRLAAAGYRVFVPYLRGHGATRFLSAATPRNGQQAALAHDILAFMDALGIGKAVIAGYDWGARIANVIAALWPERCKAMVSVSGYIIGSQDVGRMPLPPRAELQWWYQYYFATPRGEAGYAQHTAEFARLIWELASPRWAFSEATFARSAVAFDNPDHVAITIHNYRWRLGLAAGETAYDQTEAKLATFPSIGVPTITIEGDANGAPHPDPATYAKRFTGAYQHRLFTGGIGHNPPQEAPEPFVQAVVDVDRL
jgi:pimeloyl-ACP methyl ester carboxylesterase